VRAELLALRKRTSTWILLAIWCGLALMFAYVVPYASYLNGSRTSPLEELLPQNLLETVMGGFPFFGGVIALMLGVLTFGSEYGWGTVKTLLTQGPGRLSVFGAKLVALAVALVGFVVVVLALGAVAGAVIGVREGADIGWPSVVNVLQAVGAGWLILAVWTSLGVLLAVLSRGTALAVGIGILYAFVVEGLLSALASQVSVVDRVVELFLRANAYSLVTTLGVAADDFRDNGPGSFSGPFVDGGQAVLVLLSYVVVFVALAGVLLRRRDVT
jgi:ABC-type transport system involved in multi-copper enzyme maturation permease subunit